ncbi:MAG: phosphomethylpyrimidine synthase ThiC, partial [Deltaproteobacteria bacterium]|nr:phosphomethylpyrimidine synthase ThiC [Deltaproteobacteria bacterium]
MGLLDRNPILHSIFTAWAESAEASSEPGPDIVAPALDQGTMVLLHNPAHKSGRPVLIGQPARIKINANLGTSPFKSDTNLEMKKLAAAEQAGAHTVMDLSTGGDLDAIRQNMLRATSLALGTVPIYALAQKFIAQGQDPAGMQADDLFAEIEKQAVQGVDFMTVHCGVTARAVELARSSGRLMGIVSRGGSLLARWIEKNDRENPLYEHYDRLLDIALRHNVTLSLGDGMRPGAVADAGDTVQWEEVVVLAELARRARDAGVQSMIEGPGHVALNQVQAQIQGIKTLCQCAPLYVLGPLTLDTAPGYDHIGGAIGGALAVMHGVDFLCYITPAENLTLPSVEDVAAG